MSEFINSKLDYLTVLEEASLGRAIAFLCLRHDRKKQKPKVSSNHYPNFKVQALIFCEKKRYDSVTAPFGRG